MKIYGNDSKKGKVLAGTFEDGVFTKRVKKAKHISTAFNCYGISEDVIATLTELQCKYVHIIEDDKIKYISDFADWKGSHVIIHDLTHGIQHFLPLKFMNEVTK